MYYSGGVFLAHFSFKLHISSWLIFANVFCHCTDMLFFFKKTALSSLAIEEGQSKPTHMLCHGVNRFFQPTVFD